MSTTSTRLDQRTVNNIALAYFNKPQNLHDAVSDLCSAGFQANHINIAEPASEATNQVSTQVDHPLINAISTHTLRWEWQRSRAHDQHRRGADQMSGLNPTPPEVANPTCSSLNLSFALDALYISKGIIWLLQHEVRKGGTYLLVDAHDRVTEASAILSGNAGHIRTAYLRGLPA